jgi:hypothetical protein
MTQKLLTLPFRLGFGAARTAFDISAKTLDISTSLVETAIGIIRPGSHETERQEETPARQETAASAPATASPRPTSPPRQTSETSERENRQRASRVNGQPTTPTFPPPAPTPATVTPPEQLPNTPLTPQQDAIKTIDEADEEEIVAEFAEPGAEDGAGAQLQVEEPWEGYALMNAGAVISRLEQADPAQLALVELYEQMHKKRQTVLSAAAKRLRALSPPETQ